MLDDVEKTLLCVCSISQRKTVSLCVVHARTTLNNISYTARLHLFNYSSLIPLAYAIVFIYVMKYKVKESYSSHYILISFYNVSFTLFHVPLLSNIESMYSHLIYLCMFI